ncbi:GumC family protein [Psychroserpens jangbogonensis]|uniref:GumC family protein n=1 Tax=Psychroserpens jangbogonensis TaxID=1484460 RepID=UPI00053D0EC2|nr:tyrosine-protein kinase family protein [Psychroserpens jangbogonensis]
MDTNKDTVINLVELYLSKWKLILVCVLIALAVAFLKIRYSTFLYQANATIKLKEDENSRSLAEISSLQNGGLATTLPNVSDEIQVIKSRAILTEVVKDLKLNIKYSVHGKVKQGEIYSNPPMNISFFMSDSLIGKINKSLFIKIISAQKFELSNVNTKKLFEFSNGETTTHSFGDKVETTFGEFVLTPNIGNYGADPDSYVEISIKPIHSVVESYLSAIKISTTEKSNVINLSLKESVKEKARLILDKVIEKYNDDVIYDKELIVKTTSDFITNRLNIVSNELEQVDFTAEKLQKNNRLTALSSQSSIFLESERQTDAKISETNNQLQLAEYMTESLNDESRDSDLLPDMAIGTSDVKQLTKSHNDLVLQRDRILKNSSNKNPTVVKLNDQINALKNNLNQSLGNIKSANEITLKNLNREGSRIRGQIYSAPGKERQFRDIKRQQDIKESLYLYLLEKREETAITLGMSTANAKVIDYAYTNDNPVSPNKRIIYLASLLLGLIIPVSLIYALDLIDNKVQTKEDVLRLVKAPFIGDIPKSDLKHKVVKKVDYSPKAEAFRIIRTNVNFMLQKSEIHCKTVFVTSTTAQEGKSHTATNLASSFSFSGKKTLLIETDIRVPRVNDYLKIKADKGLTEFISDKSLNIEDVTIKAPENSFLDVIPSGAIPPNPAELLMSDRVTYLFDNAKKQYDYIIVDTAAVGLVTDTLLICDHADIFIYVVSANNIDKRQLHIAQTMYEEKRLPNMVTLLNGSVKKKGYGYGYGNNPQQKKKWYNPFK